MTSHRQHDRIEAARQAHRDRMVAAGIRGSISIPAVPATALPDPGYYEEPPEVETQKLDPAGGRRRERAGCGSSAS